MRRLILLFLIALMTVPVVKAQVAMLDKASVFIQKKDFTKALEAISIAEKNETTELEARTYYLKAFALSEQSRTNSKDKVHLPVKAMEAIKKCRSLDAHQNYETSLTELERFISVSVFNSGIESFNKKEYSSAIQDLNYFLSIVTAKDSAWLDAQYYLGIAFFEGKQYDSALTRLNLVRSGGYDQPLLYLDLALLHSLKSDETETQKILAEGIQLYPTNYDLQMALINFYAEHGRFAELEPLGESLLKQYSNNIELMLVVATAYDHNKTEKNKDTYLVKSTELYGQILKVAPGQYDANYNLGVLYYNEAVDLITQNDLDTDLEQLNKVLEKSTKLFEQSLPYLTKIRDDQKADIKLLKALQGIYYNLNMKSEFAQVSKQIASIPH